MKEFMIKHPYITLFGIATIVDGVVKIAKLITLGTITDRYLNKEENVTAEEETEDESSGDIQ